MAERWGGRHVVGISLFLSGALTGLSPLLAQTSFWPIFVARFLLGVFGVSSRSTTSRLLTSMLSISTACNSALITCCDANFHQMRSETSLQCQCFCLLSHDINYCLYQTWFATLMLINSTWQCQLTRKLQWNLLTSGCFHLGNCFSGTAQSRVTMGAERWKGKVRFCLAWRCFGERHNLGHAWTDHRESRLEVWLLYPCIDDIHICSLLVPSRRWLTSRSFENLKEWTWIHSRLPRRHCVQGKELPAGSLRHFFGSVLCSNNSPLRFAVGTLLPANCRANVHDWSFEL